ncbi:hypothetical protein [Maribacter aestuarii]|uniref:hypothetical protein n=1 Tax=Maribacter aestuarii TaxID=1130723 RepID=UPI00248C37B9|nr:hypothetical protein [Maribacter aestuarii]
MNKLFDIKRTSYKTITELPDSWSEQDFKHLLKVMEFDGIADLAPEELREMCLMSLTDNEPEDAAKIVLEYVFKGKLNKGQVENLSNELLDEKLWEEYADLSMHENFFKVHQLLYNAFEGTFPHPEAVSFSISVSAKEKGTSAYFDDYPEAPLLRLLVAGMPQNNLIYRLFDEQIDGETFKEARDIIWKMQMEKISENEILFNIISSSYWFKDFKYVDAYEAATHPDE